MDVDEIGLRVAQDANGHRIGKRRLMALVLIAHERRHDRAQLAHPVDDDAVALLARGQPTVLRGDDGDLVSARGHVLREQPRLVLRATDERRIVVGDEQQSHVTPPVGETVEFPRFGGQGLIRRSRSLV